MQALRFHLHPPDISATTKTLNTAWPPRYGQMFIVKRHHSRLKYIIQRFLRFNNKSLIAATNNQQIYLFDDDCAQLDEANILISSAQ